jgi:SAM-dependent methyltransferase
MSTSTVNVDTSKVLNAVQEMYEEVATCPNKEFHFPTGHNSCLNLGYPEDELDAIPDTAVESFAGVGYPFLADVIQPGDTVLDIGSGSAADVLIAARKTGTGGQVYGIDIAKSMINKARKNIEKTGVKNIKILRGNAEQIPFVAIAQEITDEGPDHHLLYEAGEIEWRDAPASLEEGAKVAVLEGNPSEPGVFTMRICMPDGFQISPHWHPNVERVTVISGTFLLGSGENVNRADTQRLEPGSYTSMPPEMVHYAIAEGETVIQLTSVGPWIINYVYPSDDPRQYTP